MVSVQIFLSPISAVCPLLKETYPQANFLFAYEYSLDQYFVQPLFAGRIDNDFGQLLPMATTVR